MTDPTPDGAPAAALVMGLPHAWVLPPPWFVPVEAPACGAELEVPPWANDGSAVRYVCDRIAGHQDQTDRPDGDPPPGKHRQVTDNDTGQCFWWDVGATIPTNPPDQETADG